MKFNMAVMLSTLRLFWRFRQNPEEFLGRYITVDETWIHYYTPETKEQSKLSNEEVIAQTDVYFEDLP